MKDAPTPRRPNETGVPDPFPHMHPILRKNYGNWDWHDRPRPGVLHHVAKGGDEVWTVRAGTQRQMDVFTIRTLCDIADEFADGHIRFTTRSNAEFMVSAEDKTAPLIERLIASAEMLGARTVRGRFQATMEVGLVNVGPVTLLLDTDKRF